jgi:hypothetical protein
MTLRLSLLAALLALPTIHVLAALPGADALAKLINSQFDLNTDQAIDADEWQSGISRSFNDMDSNSDGSLTPDEIDGLRGDIAKETGELSSGIVVAIIKQVILTFDKDGDMTVSHKEYDEPSEAIFKKLDADSNYSLSNAELANLPVKVITG